MDQFLRRSGLQPLLPRPLFSKAKSRVRPEAVIVQPFDCVLMPCSAVTPVVSLLLLWRDPEARERSHATARFHPAVRRRGSVAARGARAAGRAHATHRRAHEHNCEMIRKSSPASRYSCKYSLSSRESDLPDPCQPTARLCPRAEDGNRRKSVLARQRSG